MIFDITVVILLSLLLVFGYSCLAMASKWDDISKEDWEEFFKMHNKEDKDE